MSIYQLHAVFRFQACLDKMPSGQWMSCQWSNLSFEVEALRSSSDEALIVSSEESESQAETSKLVLSGLLKLLFKLFRTNLFLPFTSLEISLFHGSVISASF